MKLKIEVDTTPAELREFFGLPEVSAIQEEMIEKLREKMLSGAEGYDPVKMLEPFLPNNLKSMESLQNAFWNMASGSGKKSGDDK
ncbi:MAG: hypothetical protein ACI8P9_005439 [Parasphingorhabdus sp.]|jgi:hypothetical protein